MLTFEFLHQVDEELDAALRQSVVERSTEATYRAVTLEAVCTARDSEVVEFLFELLVLVVEDEAYVHDRAVFGIDSTAEEAVAVDFIVEHASLFEVHLLEGP